MTSHTAAAGMFELVGPDPLWIWVHTCPAPRCQCRTATVLATEDGPEALLARGAPVADACRGGDDYRAVARSIPGVVAFDLEIDSLEITNSGAGADEARVQAVRARMDGEVLEAIGDLWYRGKGQRPPHEALAEGAGQIHIKGWKSGDLLAWNDVAKPSRQDLYYINDYVFEAIERYCPVPGCDCGEVWVTFDDPLKPGTGVKGEVVFGAEGSPRLEPPPPSPWLAACCDIYCARHPRRRERFERRRQVMKRIGARLRGLASSPAAPAMKPGRNDPCTCGSGKKYKKCCGA